MGRGNQRKMGLGRQKREGVGETSASGGAVLPDAPPGSRNEHDCEGAGIHQKHPVLVHSFRMRALQLDCGYLLLTFSMTTSRKPFARWRDEAAMDALAAIGTRL